MARHVFLHIGDAHLSPGPRQADRLAALDQIVERARALSAEHVLAAVLWPGDLFHARSTIDDRNALAPRLQALAQLAPVVIVPGNHDAPGDLDVFSRLAAPQPVVVATLPTVHHVRTATGTVAAIFCLPYVHRAGLVSAGADHASLGQEARALLEPVFMSAAQELNDAVEAGEIPLMVGHINVGGAVSSVGQPQIGREIELDPALLERLGPLYKGLNHIHRHQAIAGAVYAGSICRMDFGENEPKGYVVVDVAGIEERPGYYPPFHWSFEPLDVPAQRHVEGRLTREGFSIEAIDGGAWGHAPEDARSIDAQLTSLFAGADVRVRYRFVKAEAGALDVGHIHATFAGCRSLKLDPVPELEHQVRAPEIAAAPTLDAKVQAYAARHGLAVTSGFLAKLSALQSQPGEQVLSAVAGAIEAPRPQAVA